ncbi:unnamed protein product [Auanema sp. JU1783]|nr:unnamed protein product [Auanema sp. JU1783]
MEYNYQDVQRTDPFLSLDVNLDDIQSVGHSEAMDCYPPVCNQWNQQPASSVYQHNPYGRVNQHSPPQQYYDPNKSREIDSVMTLLQSDSPPHHDPYAMKFSPPNFESLPNYNSTARMLSQLGSQQSQTQSEANFQPGSLAQKLAAPAMQPLPAVHSPPAMYVEERLSPSYIYKPPKIEPTAEPAFSSTPRKPSNTKEELLRLLVNMSPGEVEMLKNRDVRPRPSAVATRVTRDQKWKEDDMSDGDDEQQEEMPTRRGPKTERRTAHNLIERKYRCSINDRIQHLKTILGGEDTKLSKSATLRKAIEHISNLEHENAALKTENLRLTSLLISNKIEIPPIHHLPPLSPTFSNSASTSGIESLESPDTNSPSSPIFSMKGNTKPKMDQVRLSIFAFMLAMLIWNPASFLAGSVAASQEPVIHNSLPIGGRVLQNDEVFDPYYTENWWQTNIIRPGFVWSVNIFVVFCVLIRLLVYGEPVQDFKSRSWLTFLSFRQRARIETDAGNVKEAMRLYMECLQILERPLPSAGLDSLLSVLWQIVRHTLNSLWIGRWFSRRKRNDLKPVTVVCKSHAHTALIYHKLHQLLLLGVDETHGSVSGLYLCLSAVNLAESAGVSVDGLPRSVMADIYIAAALRTRLCLYSPFAKIISMYFFRRARRHVRRSEENAVNGLAWLFHPLSKSFLSNPETLEALLTSSSRHASFTSENLDVSPVSKLRSHFKLHLIQLLSSELSGDLEEEIDVIDVSRLLLSMSTGGGTPKKENDWNCDTTVADGDPLCSWWTHVLTCALLWRQGRNELAKKHYTVVRQCPKELLAEPLALAVGHAFCARKICIEDRNNAQFGKFVFVHCQSALETMRIVHRKEDSQIQEIQDLLSVHSYEWVLSSLLDAWRTDLKAEQPYWTQIPKFDFRILYQEATNHYVHISDRTIDNSGARTLVYHLTCRMLNGANPIETMTSVSRIAKHLISVASGNAGLVSRADQPDPFHLHVLTKLHANLGKRSELLK